MAKAAETPRPKDDPYNLHGRTERVYDWLLSDWESDPKLKNRADAIKILQYGSAFLVRNIKLREVDDVAESGSAVRRYSSAFRTTAAHDPRRRKASAGPSTKPTLVTDDDSDEFDPDAAA